jgi:cation diffusion facilitator CzcD-associated flavoprotein CzcO
MSSEGVMTTDGEYAIDDLILATGFDAVTGALARIDVRGTGGTRLTEHWAHGPSTFLGIAVAGFPNMFLINGPGSPAAFTNIATHTEINVEWLTDLIGYALREGLTWIEADREAEREWTEHVRETAEGTLYPRADSWYLGANIPGKPRVFMFYVGGLDRYVQKCRAVADGNYAQFITRTI